MNLSEFTYLLNHPQLVNQKNTQELDKIVNEFPYFQSARALQLKGLFTQNSFQYNQSLRITASYTTDRNLLFDFITSGDFEVLEQQFLEEKKARINEILVHDFDIVEVEPLSSANNAKIEHVNNLEEKVESIGRSTPEIVEASDRLEIGKPIHFSKEEKHSFNEWLKMATFSPIVREKETIEQPEIENKKPVQDNSTATKTNELSKKFELIDKFIEANPKITPSKSATATTIITKNSEESGLLMTETLAKVYLEQKKYQKAIQAYEILILKYPEKSSLFADRILDIKILQQNNN